MSHSLVTYVTSGGLYALSSVTMFLVNKLAIHAFPLTCSLIYLQNATTIVILLLLWTWNEQFAVEWDNQAATRWLPAVAAFTTMLVSSLQGMKYISIPTFVVFRNLNSLSVALGDRFILQRKITPLVFVSLVIIPIGSFVYGYYDLQFHPSGYVWIMINLLSMAVYTIYVKWITIRHKYTSFTMSFYNNILSIPPLLVLMMHHNEVHPAIEKITSMSMGQLLLLTLSCVLGFCISYFGFAAQRVFSATAWITINNLNKIPAIYLGILVFGDKISWMSFFGLCISMGGGFLFAYEGYRIKKAEDAARQKGAVP